MLLSAVVVLLLSACGTQRVGAGSPTTTQAPHWQTFAPFRVTAARLSDGGRALSVDAEVPGKGKTCARRLKAVVTATPIAPARCPASAMVRPAASSVQVGHVEHEAVADVVTPEAVERRVHL